MFQSIFYSVVQCLFIYFSVCTYSLYEKIKNEQGTAQCQLTTIQSIPMVENVQQIQPGVLQITTSQQPQEYPQKYPQDRGFQQTQVDQQPPTYQELSKSAEAVQ